MKTQTCSKHGEAFDEDGVCASCIEAEIQHSFASNPYPKDDNLAGWQDRAAQYQAAWAGAHRRAASNLARAKVLEEELAALKEENQALRMPFEKWIKEIFCWAVEQSKNNDHAFLWTPDGEVLSDCLRCLNNFGNAPQGCIEHTRDRRIAAEDKVRALENQLKDLEKNNKI